MSTQQFEIGRALDEFKGQRQSLRTSDGTADCFFFPALATACRGSVLFYMDAHGILPAIFKMANRLAVHGNQVLVPNFALFDST